ncbi:hypothetical protein ACFWAR_01020 [Streptomyces sp. NPDC059917]|uniref:hypothetical protein n=1 Tax=Streptomyces sp. NPDC059917 TaxID=3347002 RepID=UPI00364D9811
MTGRVDGRTVLDTTAVPGGEGLTRRGLLGGPGQWSSDDVVRQRLAIDVTVLRARDVTYEERALTEVAVHHELTHHMLEVEIEVDGVPVTGFGCDGVVCATPTGSVALDRLAGGPAVWPDVDALIMAPLRAHGLFSRPLMVPPASRMAVTLQQGSRPGVLWCDGHRTVPLAAGDRIEVRRSARAVPVARPGSFSTV